MLHISDNKQYITLSGFIPHCILNVMHVFTLYCTTWILEVIQSDSFMPQFMIWFFISQRGDSYICTNTTVFCWSLIWRGTSVPRRFTVQPVAAEIFTLMTWRKKAAGRRGSASRTSAALLMQRLLCSSSSFIPLMWRVIPYSGFLHRWSH